MASQNTTLFASQLSPAQGGSDYASGQALPSSTEAGGRCVIIADTFTTTSAVTTSQTITLCKLPAGAKVVSLELLVPAGVGTSSAKVGYFPIQSDGTLTSTGADDDRWGSAVDLSGVGRKQFVTVAADADFVTTSEVAVVLSPVTTSFATPIAFAFVITYVAA